MSVAGAFAAQAESCAALGSPFMARALRLLGERLDPGGRLGARLHAWPGDMSARGDAVPLRLAAGLHALVLSGRAPALAPFWPAPPQTPEADLWSALAAALTGQEAFLLDWLDHAPQTNEVARSAALIAAAHWLGGPLAVSELGAAAGLNLLFDRWRLDGPGWHRGPADAAVVLRPDWSGPPPPETPPQLVDRAGVDLQVDADDANLIHGSLLPCGDDSIITLAHRDAVGRGHPLHQKGPPCMVCRTRLSPQRRAGGEAVGRLNRAGSAGGSNS